MKKKNPTSIARLHEVFLCDPGNGELRWRVQLSPTGKLGDLVCRGLSHGYKQVRLDGQVYKQHHIIWAMHHGEWPRSIIDHANGDRADNRIGNLRATTARVNLLNAPIRRDNTSDYRGVFWDNQRGKWRVESCNKYIGRFSSKEAAIAAYIEFVRVATNNAPLPNHPLASSFEKEAA